MPVTCACACQQAIRRLLADERPGGFHDLKPPICQAIWGIQTSVLGGVPGAIHACRALSSGSTMLFPVHGFTLRARASRNPTTSCRENIKRFLLVPRICLFLPASGSWREQTRAAFLRGRPARGCRRGREGPCSPPAPRAVWGGRWRRRSGCEGLSERMGPQKPRKTNGRSTKPRHGAPKRGRLRRAAPHL